MKITSQEEYGLRILLRIAQCPNSEGLTIPQISEEEGLSQHYVAKLCRILRLAGLIKSSRGKEGGYTLARSADQISVPEILSALGTPLYSPGFCTHHTGNLKICSHTVDCTVRPLWEIIQRAIDNVLQNVSLKDLLPGNSLIPSVEHVEIDQENGVG